MRALLILLACFNLTVAFAQVVSPKKGSPERAAIVDALRAPVQKELKQKVQFRVDLLRVQGGWAFIKVKPQQPNGKSIDYSKTAYKEAIKAGAFDDWACALLKKKGEKWTVITFRLGATDVPYVDWPKQFGAPKTIFDMPG